MGPDPLYFKLVPAVWCLVIPGFLLWKPGWLKEHSLVRSKLSSEGSRKIERKEEGVNSGRGAARRKHGVANSTTSLGNTHTTYITTTSLTFFTFLSSEMRISILPKEELWNKAVLHLLCNFLHWLFPY